MLKLQGECWVITDAAAGNQRQALALAEQLQLPIRHLLLEPRAPWSWLAPRLTLGGRLALPAAQRELFAPPWPRVAIGCGRAAALFTRLLRGLSEGQCHTVQILDPRIDPAHWDTVIAPQHDRIHGANVLRPLGSLNTVDDAWLADGRDACPSFADLPQPRVGVLLGGPRQGIALDADYTRQLAARLLERQRREGGSLLVLASRRTPAAVIELFRRELKGVPGLVWAGHDDGRNPYPGVLGWADRLVVTPDSVNMLSEACAVGCAVQTFITTPLPAKLARFHQSLRAAGRLQDLDGTAPNPPAPLRETASIGAELRARIERMPSQPTLN
jgi:mitochondrial fission protein ELM1